MEFRDLKKQYETMEKAITGGIQAVLSDAHYIQGRQVKELEDALSEYVGVKHCITCANGTDALQLALMAWNISAGDAVFVPDFTFFSSGEVVAAVGAAPVFVDVDPDTYNMSVGSLRKMIEKTIAEGNYLPKAIIAVDLFGQPADYEEIRKIADEYHLRILEDGAQGFGGAIGDTRACAFGDISTTSFFPAKPLGCYGDGGAVFTDDAEWAKTIRSLAVHGKGESKYDNVRIGMNSRLDTIQAAVLLAKLSVFCEKELDASEKVAQFYTERLRGFVKTPMIRKGFFSSWAQYTIQVDNRDTRDGLQQFLKESQIPTAVYYQKPMHCQKAFHQFAFDDKDYPVTNRLSDIVLSLPFHPYMEQNEAQQVVDKIIEYVGK